MQTSAAIAAAAVAQERNPVATLSVDWDADGSYSQTIDNLSARIESLTIDRQLATDLPDEVSRVAGYSVAQLSATLSGDPTTEATNAASYFSPFNTASALYGKRRRWRTCQVQIGFGSTTLPAFTGKTTGLVVDSASRTATLDALDLAETMRGVVDLPMVVKDDLTTGNGRIASGWRPNLNASWVVDYIARKCGYYASPPPRTGCKLLCTYAGSATPEVGGASGDFIYNIVAPSPSVGPVQFVTGKFIQALNATGIGNGNLTPLPGLNLNNNGEILNEGWIYVPGTGRTRGFAGLSDANSLGHIDFELSTTNALSIVINRNGTGTTYTWNTGLTVPSAQFVYVAYHVYFTSTTITLQARVGATSASTSIATVSITGQPDITDYMPDADSSTSQNASDCYFEAWQLSNPGITTGTPTWNDAYVGNSTIQPSLNQLTATIPGPVTAWDQIQALAAAEFATAGFTEAGTFYYYARNRWTSAPYTVSQRTISAADSLTAIATSESIDQVRNHVRITASPAALNPVAGWVWALSDVVSIPAGGNTTITADTGTPAYNLSTSIRYASTSGLSGQSQYRANTARDGSGSAVSNLTFTVTVVGAQIVTITIHNPGASTVYMVSSSGFTDPVGTPSLALWGQPVTFGTTQQPDTTASTSKTTASQSIDIKDATSIGQHGDQLLELSGNPWLQDATSLTTFANDLLARLKDPVPILEGLTIVGDPRLQLGDRVTVVEPALGLNGDFFISGIASTFDRSGYTQALTVRGIS